MNKVFVFTIILFISIILNSCWTINIKPSELENKLVTLSRPQEQVEIVGHFRQDFTYWFAILGIVRLNKPNLDNYYAEQIDKFKGDGICNLSYTTKYGGGDVFNDALSAGVGYLIGYYVLSKEGQDNRQSNGWYGSAVGNAIFSSRTLTITGDVYKKVAHGNQK